jgi:hypothetical protein
MGDNIILLGVRAGCMAGHLKLVDDLALSIRGV